MAKINPIYDVQNYSISELEEMLTLPPNYTSDIIEIKQAKFKDKMLNSEHINEEIKGQVLRFVDNARRILENKVQNQNPFLSNQYPFYEKWNKEKEKEKESKITHSKKYLNIDSRFRSNYNSTFSSNFNVKLPFKINNINEIELVSVEMPTTFYAISKEYGNDFFFVEVESTEINLKYMIQIPEGNYDSKGFIDALNNRTYKTTRRISQNLLTDYTTDIFKSLHFELTNDNNGTGTSKVKVSIVSQESSDNLNRIIQTKLIFNEDVNENIVNSNPLGKKLGWIIGFRKESYILNEYTHIIPEGILNVTGPKYIFLVVDDHNNNNGNSNAFMNSYNSISLNQNILARIPLTLFSVGFQIVNSTNFNATPRKYANPINTDEFTFQLLDEYGTPLFLNNMDYSCCLALNIIHEK